MKISIITITLNSDSTIRDTLNSVMSQTYKNIEHIIVDGGSTDTTLPIIKRYPNKRKKVIVKSKSKIYEAMNIGIKAATGEYIAILNSDDIYQSNKVIEEVVKFIKKNKSCGVFLGNLIYFKGNDYYNIIRYYSATIFKKWMIRFGLMPPHPASFIKKELYEKFGLYNENFKIASDFDFFLRLLYLGKVRFKVINKTIVRMRAGGVSGKDFNSYITTNREIKKSFEINKLNFSVLQMLARIPSKLKQLIFYNQKLLNKNFKLDKVLFDKKQLFINNFNIIDDVKKIPLQKNFILSGMNLAFLGYYASGKVYPFKDLYHWPDGVFIQKFIDIKKIPGREIIKKLQIPSSIKRILILGDASEASIKYLKNKFKLSIKNIALPYGSIDIIKKKKIKLSNNTLVFITLPTPKQEQFAYELCKYNDNYKIICIGASLAIASGEEKTVPLILSKYEFLWRLRSETFRRTKRLLETYYFFKKAMILSKLFKKTSFRIF